MLNPGNFEALKHHSIETLEMELNWLLREVTSLDRLSLRLETFRSQPTIDCARSLAELDQLWLQRLQDCVPVQYLVGRVTWRHFQLQVSPAVLIPRPETELIIDCIIEATQNLPRLRQGAWADLGTGSGAIALGLVDAFPEINGHAVDISPEALAIATQNARNLKLDDRIRFLQGSWFEPLADRKAQLSGIVSNPPYIPSPMVAQLQPEVMRHEPRLALDGGMDGLDAIRHLIHHAHRYLKPGGLFIMECMAGQGIAIQALLQADGHYQNVTIHQDWANLDRFTVAYAKGGSALM